MKRIITYFIAAILIASSLYSQDEEKSRQIQNFKDKYPGELSIQWDKISGGPKRIMGNNIYLKSHSVNKTNIHALTKDFINENGDLLNVRNTEVELESITELENKFIVTYQQLYNKIPLWNVKLKLKIAANGQVLMIKSPCFDNPSVSVQPNITVEEAKKNAATNLNTEVESVRDGELLIYPQRKTGKLYLCWHIRIENGINKGVMIDAETGQKIFEYDLYRNAEIRGTVRTTTWSIPGQTDGSPDITPYCQDLKVNVTDVGSANTNSSGYYSVTVPSAGDYTVTSSLDGPHCWVINWTGSEDSHSNTASTSSDHNWTWQNSGHYNEYFVFHYMNNAWHEFNDKVSGFSSNYWYSQKMEGRANYGTGVNGSANGTLMTITTSNHYGCSVYHEYSHNVNYRANGYWLGDDYDGDGYAMDEGLADYYSCSFRNDPLRYAVSRRLDTKMKYPGSGGAHTRGQIIGGACWDLGNKSGMSHNSVNALVYEAITNMGFEETFGDFMDEILNADDDDGNIFNGTPHDNQIFEAFDDDHWILGTIVADTVYRDMTWEDDITVLGDVTISNGITLEIEPNVNVTFAPMDVEAGGINSSKSEIIVDGTLIANGATFTATSKGDWYGIVFNSGASSSSYLDGCTIENGYIGVYIDGSDPTIDDCEISDCSVRGVYVKGSAAQPTIQFCHIHDNDLGAMLIENDANPRVYESKIYAPSGTAAYIYSADGLFCGNEFRTSTSAYGLVVYGSTSAPEFNEDYYQGNLWDMAYIAGSRAVNIPSGYPEFGDSPVHTGANDFLHIGANEYYIYNASGNTILAESNYWGAAQPQESWFYGSVDKNPYESSSQNAGPSWKIKASPYQDALIAYDEGKYEEAMQLFESLLTSEPAHERIARIVFLYCKSAYKLGCLNEKLNVLADFTSNLANEELQHADRVWKAYYYAATGDMEAAKAVSLSAPSGSNSERELLLSLIGYYISNENRQGAEDVASLLRQSRKDDPTLEEDIAMMLCSTKLSFGNEALPKQTQGETEPSAVSLNVYPNPFNPETEIRFQLPEDSHVTLSIFNLLGQKVRGIIDEKMAMGYHSIKWDGKDALGNNLTSGIYIYRLEAGSFVGSKKLMLIR